MSTEQEKTNEQILKDLIQAFSSLKQKMEDPNYAALDSQMRNMLENQKDMKADVKDLKAKPSERLRSDPMTPENAPTSARLLLQREGDLEIQMDWQQKSPEGP